LLVIDVVPGTSIVGPSREHQSDLLDVRAELDGAEAISQIGNDSVDSRSHFSFVGPGEL